MGMCVVTFRPKEGDQEVPPMVGVLGSGSTRAAHAPANVHKAVPATKVGKQSQLLRLYEHRLELVSLQPAERYVSERSEYDERVVFSHGCRPIGRPFFWVTFTGSHEQVFLVSNIRGDIHLRGKNAVKIV
jgi:hypothetical protein